MPIAMHGSETNTSEPFLNYFSRSTTIEDPSRCMMSRLEYLVVPKQVKGSNMRPNKNRKKLGAR